MNEQILMEMQMQQPPVALGIGMIIFFVVLYVFFAFCLARLATKMGMPFGKSFIWALIPIANMFLFIKLSEKPYWWFILMFIPIANIVVMILMWMAIAEKLGRPGWWGVCIALVPILNIILFLILVFGEKKAVGPAATT